MTKVEKQTLIDFITYINNVQKEIFKKYNEFNEKPTVECIKESLVYNCKLLEDLYSQICNMRNYTSKPTKLQILFSKSENVHLSSKQSVYNPHEYLRLTLYFLHPVISKSYAKTYYKDGVLTKFPLTTEQENCLDEFNNKFKQLRFESKKLTINEYLDSFISLLMDIYNCNFKTKEFGFKNFNKLINGSLILYINKLIDMLEENFSIIYFKERVLFELNLFVSPDYLNGSEQRHYDKKVEQRQIRFNNYYKKQPKTKLEV